MWRKIIDFLRSKSCVAYFKFVWTLLSSVLVVFNNFLEVKLEAIKSVFYRIKPIPPFIFREHSL